MATPRISFTTPPNTKHRNSVPAINTNLPNQWHITQHISAPTSEDITDVSTPSSPDSASSIPIPAQSANMGTQHPFESTAFEVSRNTLRTSALVQASAGKNVGEVGEEVEEEKEHTVNESGASVKTATRAELLAEMDRVRVHRLGKEPFPSVFLSWKAC
ncbi:hypothetical protein OPT61_g9160 [Boeremia exigua]|uniref:Uncharacterized protein n=1 Tax=Boeremia exigua TaxID=749465 RepID=A0ACC2HWB9_9PLEO|nr:hypothetical protein OPT61_g9160 [Boeremia exigua]